jgi:hypothetical protein
VKDKYMSDEEVDKKLMQLDIMEKQFDFYIKETSKVDIDVEGIDDDTGGEEIETLNRRVEELFVRYQKDVKAYQELIKEIELHFKNKYGLDLDLQKYK